MRPLTDAEWRCLDMLVCRNTAMSAANLGDALWPKRRGGNCSCPCARPAGAVLARLRKLGLTTYVRAEGRSAIHEITAVGIRVHREQRR